MKLLRVKIEGLDRFENGLFDIDFVAKKRVFEYEVEDGIVFPLANSIYSLNSVAFVGINASGKTTAIRLVKGMLDVFLTNASLNYNSELSSCFSGSITTTNYVQHDNFIYKIESDIIKNDQKRELYFNREKLYRKKFTKSSAKNTLYDFSDKHLIVDRDTLVDVFLKREDSIFSSVLNEIDLDFIVCDINQKNTYPADGLLLPAPQSFINYLDPSIKTLEKILDKEDNKAHALGHQYLLEFKESEKPYIVDNHQLDRYLSSGTVKGMETLLRAMLVLNLGSYLIIDEIENHLNKALVIGLIDLFNSTVNVNGATLIFTTHYTEIIDTITRSDSIYLMKKEKSISANRFSDLLGKSDRNDKNKSDIILSGQFGTAPTYQSYQELKALMKYVASLHGPEEEET